MQRANRLATGQRRVGGVGGRQRGFVVHGGQGVDARVDRVDAGQHALRGVARRDAA